MTSDGSNGSNEDDAQERRIILHVYDDESRDFTDLTTYHGMRRIYSSNTWPSRIFWSLVVVTCLTLFMIHSGLMLFFYNSHPTFTKTLDVPLVSKFLPSVTLCKSSYSTEDNLHRIAYQILNDVPLNADDLKNLRQISSQRILEDYLNHTKTVCEGSISSEDLTDIGYCLSFSYRDLTVEASDSLEIEINTSYQELFSFQIHSYGASSNMKSKRRYLRTSLRSMLSVGISTEKLLHQNDWGSCHNEFQNLHYDGQLYQQNECEKNCVAMQYIERCSCVPFHLAKKGVKVCSLQEMLMCKQTARPTTTCDCPLECERLLYEVSEPSYVKLRTTNRSILHMEFPSSKVLTHFQQKRIKAVDLLSFVAGSMGLFLGMSCVTLLEIFIYLFKSVWGVFNDERHKTYWGNIIGDDDVDKRRQSYEQIVITTKSKGDPSHTSKPVVEENYAVIRNPATRRASIMRMGPPTYAEDGRSRSNTVKSTDTIPPALTIRLTRRPSVAVGRRKSVYNAFGNF